MQDIMFVKRTKTWSLKLPPLELEFLEILKKMQWNI